MADLVGTNAVHHFGPRGLGGCLHHITAWRPSSPTPDGLPAHGDRFCLFAVFRAKAFEHLHRDFLLGEALDFHHEAFFVHADQADGFATVTSTARTANAVHVVFRDVGDLVIDNVRQLIDIDAACGNVSGNQGTDVPALEARQCLRACALALVAVQRHGLHAILGEEFRDVVCTKLGARKHQHLAPVVLLDDMQQHLLLLGTTHRVDDLGNALHRGVARGHLDALRVLEQGGCQVTDLVAEGSREQQTLLFLGHQGENFLYVMDETHVEHAVSFVQDQYFHRGKIQKTLLLQIQQTAGRGHQEINTALDAVDLGVHADTAKDHGGTEIQVFTVLADRFLDLRGQFACGGQHQSAHALAAKFALWGGAQRQAVQQGQGEGGRLAGASLCTGQQVLAL